MILFQLLIRNFSLIDKGLYYFRVKKCMLDIPSLVTTIYSISQYSVDYSLSVRGCSWYQIKVIL